MNNFLVDTHAHIYSEYYANIADVLKRAEEAGIKYIINAGCDTKSNEEILKLLSNSALYGVIGIHPENVHEYTDADLAYVEENCQNPKIIGIGEIGLDYHYEKTSKEEQIKLLEAQLKIAENYHKPVVIHSREATQDTIDTLKKYHVKGVIHSFSGSLEVAKIYIKMGYLLGVNGVVTFKNSNIKDVYREIPLENIILETDAPYLTPHPYRGSQNEPKYIKNIAEFIAELKGITVAEVARQTNANIIKLFGPIF